MQQRHAAYQFRAELSEVEYFSACGRRVVKGSRRRQRIRDDKIDTVGARDISIELRVFAAPAGERVTTQHAHRDFGQVEFGSDTYKIVYHTITRRLKLRLPPPVIRIK